MPTPLPFRLRMLTDVATIAIKRGWMSEPVAQLEKPHAERLARNAMRIACKPGDPSIRTQDVRVEGRGGAIPARVSRLTRRADDSMDEMARETTKIFERSNASGR